MASEANASPNSTEKRTRRSKKDPQFVFDRSTDEGESEKSKRTSSKVKTSRPVESTESDVDLYQPGDIVWCKLGNFPWWPALVYRCDAEGGIHTKLLNSNNKPKRLFFVYFYGKYLEYSWISNRWLLKYAGLSKFIQHAEAEVQQASTKSEQQELANRYQLKVSMKKRVQWDEAIELADQALSMSNAERIKQFSELLEEASGNQSTSKSTRRRKISAEKSEEEPEAKRATREPTPPAEAPVTTTETETDSTVMSKKKGRNSSRSSRSSTKKETLTNGSEIEYDYPLPNANDPAASAALLRLIPTNIPPLSNFEQKQIVEGLLHHPKGKTLTFDEALNYAVEKAMEIVYDNHHYRMTQIAPEWFYETILLKYPSVVFHYRSWFDHVKTDLIPNGNDLIQLRLWQIALMVQAQIKAEEQKTSIIDS